MPHRRAVLGSLSALPLAGCATAFDVGTAAPLSLVTFNIWHNQGDWPARLPLLVGAIRAEAPDVVALQEVLEDAAVGLPNQAGTIATAIGGQAVLFCSTDAEGSGRRYGNAILTRHPVLEHGWKRLEPLDDYRTALRVRVRHDGRPVDIVNTHLAWQADAQAVRARQIADLIDWLPRDGTPLVVMGDFNAVQEDAGLAALTGSRFFSALPRGAVGTTLNPARGHPDRVIDHIFAEARAFAPVSAHRIGDQPTAGEWPSDHFGVAARVRLT